MRELKRNDKYQIRQTFWSAFRTIPGCRNTSNIGTLEARVAVKIIFRLLLTRYVAVWFAFISEVRNRAPEKREFFISCSLVTSGRGP